MIIKIWGCRGSLPSPGADTVRYGGESTCLELITDEGEVLVVDAGSGIRKLGNDLIKRKVKKVTLLLTHAHWDHLAGFPFFRPAYFPDCTITVCGGLVAHDSVINYLKHQMAPPFFPVDFSAMKAEFKTGCHCDSGICSKRLPETGSSFLCESIPLNHPNGGYGFKFTGKIGTFVFLTDNELRFHHEGGLTRKEYIDFCRDADLLFHDAQYLEKEYEKTRSWGHSTFQDAIDVAIEAGVKKLGLLHHDPERSDDEIDRQIEWCTNYIRRKGSSLECFACAEGMTLSL